MKGARRARAELRLAALILSLTLLQGVEGIKAGVKPSWGSSDPKPSAPQPSAPQPSAPQPSYPDVGSEEETCPSGQCEMDHGFPPDVPVPPPFTNSLSLPIQKPQASRISEVDPKVTSLHIPAGTKYRHGVTVGMSVVARNTAGEAIPAAGLTFMFNVTNAGDSSTGTVFDLQNGSYFVYSTVYYSPAIDSSPGAEVWARLGGQHIKGSPFRIEFDMPKISEFYQRRVSWADQAGADPTLGGPEGCDSDFVFITGASGLMFDRAVNLVGSMHHWSPGTRIIFYDLGLSAHQLEDVKTWEDVEYRKFDYSIYPPHVGALGENGSYAWRSPILVNVSNEHKCSLWLDAGLEIRGDMSRIKGHIAVDGGFFATNGWPNPNKFTHPAVIEWHGLTEKDFFLPQGRHTRHEIEACGGIQGYRRGSLAHEYILEGYHRCLIDPGCSTPKGASKSNYRQDQTVLNVFLTQFRKQLELDSEEYFLTLPHTARKYWEHPIPKHQFPVRDDGTFRPCDKGQVFKDGECSVCDDPDGICEDDVLDELEGAEYVKDLVIFIRRAFEPKLYEESLRYTLVGSI